MNPYRYLFLRAKDDWRVYRGIAKGIFNTVLGGHPYKRPQSLTELAVRNSFATQPGETHHKRNPLKFIEVTRMNLIEETQMPIEITKNDVLILETLADYRLLTATQLALLTNRNENGLRRRLRTLRGSSLIDLMTTTTSTNLGRPSDVFSLSVKGLSLLQREGVLSKTLEFSQVDGKPLVSQVSHQLLLNWCRIHLEYMSRQMKDLSVKCLAMNSSFAARRSGILIPVPDNEGIAISEKAENGFIVPDAAFAISSTVKAKTLLFFLEVDMGSEPILAARQKRSSIGKKAIAYLAYFRSFGYKNYEDIFKASFHGFRLLFLTPSQERMGTLCRTFSRVQSDFIWITTATRMFEEGISGPIWARGGNLNIARQSILGSLGQKIPIPAFGK